MELEPGWVLLTRDTDCTSCHYTIRSHDPEGMCKRDGKLYCTVACAEIDSYPQEESDES